MIHSGWITNSRWPCKHMCLDSLGNLPWVGAQRVIWVIGTTLRIGVRQSGAISNSVLICATQMRSPCLRPVVTAGKCGCPSFHLTSLAFTDAELIAGTWRGLVGLTRVVNIFSDVGWLAMVRNNFMMAFFSERKTLKLRRCKLRWLNNQGGRWLVPWGCNSQFSSPRVLRKIFEGINTIASIWRENYYPIYYPTALRRVQITLKTSTNITRYLYSRGPVRQVSCHWPIS